MRSCVSLLLVAATELELRPFRDLAFPSTVQVDFLVSGIGLLASSCKITEILANAHYDLVLQLGIAGTFELAKYPLGSLVIVGRDCEAQLGVWQNGEFWDIFRLELAESRFPFRDGYLENPYISQIPKLLPVVNGISVSTISTEPSLIEYYCQRYKAEIESMEGASLHYVCLMRGIRFFQLRGISNVVGDRNKQNWQTTETLNKIAEFLTKNLIAFI